MEYVFFFILLLSLPFNMVIDFIGMCNILNLECKIHFVVV